MAKHLRLVGIAMIGVGALALATYVFEPLQLVWQAYQAMPVALRIGIAVAAIGLVILMLSLVVERRRDKGSEGDLTID